MNKTLKVMTSAALLAGVVAPVAVTTADAANSKNYVDRVLYVDDDYESGYDATLASKQPNFLYIQEDDIDFDNENGTFRLSMPSGAKWLEDIYTTKDVVTVTPGQPQVKYIDKDGKLTADAPTTDQGFEIVSVTETDLELKIAGDWSGTKVAVKVPMYFEVDGGEGELKVTVDRRDSVLNSGQYTFAVVGEGNTTVSISKVETIGDGGSIGTIRLDETSIGALYEKKYDLNESATAQKQTIKLRLPSDFEWKNAVAPTVGGGFTLGGNIKVAAGDVYLDNNKRDLIIKFNFDGKPSKIGTFYLGGLAINADNDADFGELEVDLSGDEVTSGSLVVAKYMEYGTNVKIEKDAPTLIAGRNNADLDDLELAEFTLKEEVPNSWLTGRSVTIALPSWVKVVGADISGIKNFKDSDTIVKNLILDDITGDDNKVEFKMPEANSTTGKRELKVKFYVSVEADKEGDITAEFSGRAGLEGEYVLGKAITPAKVEVVKTQVRTGIKGQEAGDIIITENAKETLAKGQVKVWLPSSVEFGATPKVEVVEGNVEIDEDTIKKSGNTLTFTIDSESTKASKIKISGVKLDLDRTVAEGDFDVKVGGSALVQNDEDSQGGLAFALGKTGSTTISIGQKDYTVDGTGDKINLASTVDVGEFDKDFVAKAVYGTVITPAEGNVSAETVTLKIGDSTMKVGDKEVAIDAAPYIEASTGRTYLPLRAIANAVGANSVEWDNASRTATVIKGGLVAQMTIGQNAYVLNGAKIGMDGKAQITSERTFLPVRALGNALGADVQWDAATQTVTIK